MVQEGSFLDSLSSMSSMSGMHACVHEQYLDKINAKPITSASLVPHPACARRGIMKLVAHNVFVQQQARRAQFQRFLNNWPPGLCCRSRPATGSMLCPCLHESMQVRASRLLVWASSLPSGSMCEHSQPDM